VIDVRINADLIRRVATHSAVSLRRNHLGHVGAGWLRIFWLPQLRICSSDRVDAALLRGVAAHGAVCLQRSSRWHFGDGRPCDRIVLQRELLICCVYLLRGHHPKMLYAWRISGTEIVHFVPSVGIEAHVTLFDLTHRQTMDTAQRSESASSGSFHDGSMLV